MDYEFTEDDRMIPTHRAKIFRAWWGGFFFGILTCLIFDIITKLF
jgi:hypothetical protein